MKGLLIALGISATAYASPARVKQAKRGPWPPTYCTPLQSILDRARNDPRVSQFCAELLGTQPSGAVTTLVATETAYITPDGYVPATTITTTAVTFAEPVTVTETPTTTISAANICPPTPEAAALLKRYDDPCTSSGLDAIKALPYYSQKVACGCLNLGAPGGSTSTAYTTTTTTESLTASTLTTTVGTLTVTPTSTETAPAETATPLTLFWVRVQSGPSDFIGRYFSPYSTWETESSRAATFEINSAQQLVISNPGTYATGDTYEDGIGQINAIGFTRVSVEDARFDDGIVFFNLQDGTFRRQNIISCCVNEEAGNVQAGDAVGILECYANGDPGQNVWTICERSSDNTGNYLWLTSAEGQPQCTVPELPEGGLMLEVVPQPEELQMYSSPDGGK